MDALLSGMQSRFLVHLEQNRPQGEPEALYGSADYLMQMGGKRMRPLLTLLGCYCCADAYDPALDASLAIEFFHGFTLVHDDIMDEAPLRRGKATVHQLYGANTAILCGDWMLIHSYDLLLRSPGKANPLDLLRVFTQTAKQICVGQQQDMEFELRPEVDGQEYKEMIRLKTAVLLGAAIEIGARIGGGSDRTARSLYAFAQSVGLAFQVRDDLLDAFGDPGQVGKRTGGDIVHNKKTFLWIACMNRADDKDREELLALTGWPVQREEEKIRRVLDLYEKYEVAAAVRRLEQAYFDEAMVCLDDAEIVPAKKEVLRNFALTLLERVS